MRTKLGGIEFEIVLFKVSNKNTASNLMIICCQNYYLRQSK